MFVPKIESVLDPVALEFVRMPVHKMLIDGQLVEAVSGETMETLDPASSLKITTFQRGGAHDVDLAVNAANRALKNPSWSRMLPADRQKLLLDLADLIEKNSETIANLETLDQGQPLWVAEMVQVNMAIDYVRYMAGWATKLHGESLDLSVREPAGLNFLAYTRREPIGVVAAVVPWNFPHLMAIWKIIPALTCGCTVVLKPAEDTPLTALFLAKLCLEVGFPPGVVNVIAHTGSEVGVPLVSHTVINKVAFTGSTETGKAIGKAAMENMTRFSLETGGKSPMLVLEDIDPDFLSPNAAMATLFNSGQQCVAGSRVYLPKKRYDQYMDRLIDMSNYLKTGSGFDRTVHLGPMVSKTHFEKVMGFIERSQDSGAKVEVGGHAVKGTKGYFVRPTILTNVDHSFECVNEEIFGPVITVMQYEDLDDLINKANDNQYGLSASIWSQNISKVNMLIPQIKAGTVWVNCHSVFDANLPFGGYKMSGMGKEHGRNAIELFTEEKAVCIAY